MLLQNSPQFLETEHPICGFYTKEIISENIIFPEEKAIREEIKILPLIQKNEIFESGILDEIDFFSQEMQNNIENITKAVIENDDF